MTSRRLAQLMLALALCLLALGGLVHATGAVAACPDWPLCAGRAFPPLRGITLWQYAHRVVATFFLVSVLTWTFLAGGALSDATRRIARGAVVAVVVQAGFLSTAGVFVSIARAEGSALSFWAPFFASAAAVTAVCVLGIATLLWRRHRALCALGLFAGELIESQSTLGAWFVFNGARPALALAHLLLFALLFALLVSAARLDAAVPARPSMGIAVAAAVLLFATGVLRHFGLLHGGLGWAHLLFGGSALGLLLATLRPAPWPAGLALAVTGIGAGALYLWRPTQPGWLALHLPALMACFGLSLPRLRAAAAVAICLLLPAAAHAGGPLFKPLELEPEAYSESLTLVAEIPDPAGAAVSSVLELELSISNIGPGDGHAACRVTLNEGASDPLSEWRHLRRHQWRHEAGPPERLVIGDCGLSAGKHFEAWGTVRGVKFHVRAAAPLRPVFPPGHRVEIEGGTFLDYYLLLTPTDVQTRVERDGKVRERPGRACLDHFRVTAMPDAVGTQLLRVRGIDAAGPWMGAARLREGAKPEGWLWALGDPAPEALLSLKLESRPGKAGKVPARRLRMRTRSHRVELRTGAPLARFAPLEEFGILGSVVSAVLGDPVTISYRASLREGRGALQPVLLHVFDVDEE